MNTTPTRIRPVLLAAAMSVLAVAVAATAHLVFGLGEGPLVIGTIVVASIAGWMNTSVPARRPAMVKVEQRRDHLHAA